MHLRDKLSLYSAISLRGRPFDIFFWGGIVFFAMAKIFFLLQIRGNLFYFCLDFGKIFYSFVNLGNFFFLPTYYYSGVYVNMCECINVQVPVP